MADTTTKIEFTRHPSGVGLRGVVKAKDAERERDRKRSIRVNMMYLLIDEFEDKAKAYLRERVVK